MVCAFMCAHSNRGLITKTTIGQWLLSQWKTKYIFGCRNNIEENNRRSTFAGIYIHVGVCVGGGGGAVFPWGGGGLSQPRTFKVVFVDGRVENKWATSALNL